jgi:cytochrome c biogenesis protein CcmG/thiol:disulfide interchange protein DsbE
METAIAFGPFTMAASRLSAVVLIWIFLAVAAYWARRWGQSWVDRAAWLSVLAGVVVARAAYVVQNFAAFAVEPWTVLAVWQGGFAAHWGVAASALILLSFYKLRLVTWPLMSLLLVLFFINHTVHMLISPAAQMMPQHIILADMDNKPLPLKSMSGRAYAVNLWASWCGPCRREMPMMMDVAGQSSVPILFANQGEDMSTIQRFLSQEGLSGEDVLIDGFGQLGQAGGSRALPTTLFVNARGEIVESHVGEISRAALLAGLKRAEAITP